VISERITQVRRGRWTAAAAAAAAAADTARATRELRTSLVSINHDNIQLRAHPSCHMLPSPSASLVRDQQPWH